MGTTFEYKEFINMWPYMLVSVVNFEQANFKRENFKEVKMQVAERVNSTLVYRVVLKSFGYRFRIVKFPLKLIKYQAMAEKF